MELKSHYMIIPTRNVWNDAAFVEKVNIHYYSKQKAIESAKTLSKTYSTSFYIMKLETLVENIFILTDAKQVNS